jgi:hypothetical protein
MWPCIPGMNHESIVSQAFPKAVILLGWVFAIFIENYFEKIIIFCHKFHEGFFAKKPYKEKKITHNCLQYDKVLRILLLLYFKYYKNLAKYPYGWFATWATSQFFFKNTHTYTHTHHIEEEYLYSNIWGLLATFFFWQNFPNGIFFKLLFFGCKLGFTWVLWLPNFEKTHQTLY